MQVLGFGIAFVLAAIGLNGVSVARADGLRDAEVMVMNADGSGVQNLTNYPAAYDLQPAWSPDGSTIAFVSFRTGNSEIYVMNADGTAPRNLTQNPLVPGSNPGGPTEEAPA
jgi:Tol biopolymer transport system component